MGIPLSQLISDLQEEHEEIIISGTTTSGGGAGFLLDTARSEADDYWVDCYLYIVSSSESSIVGLERDISSSTSTGGRIDFAPNLPAVVPTGTVYEVRRKLSRASYKKAVNFAVLSAEGWRNEMDVDDTQIAEEDVLDYAFPSGLLFMSELWIEQRTVMHKRTATGGLVTELEDTGATFGDDVDGETVAIYGGTGTSQVRTIQSHTATTLLPTLDFATAPDDTSKYVVLRSSQDVLAPKPLVGYRPDMAGEVIRLAAEPADLGQKLLIFYEKAPTKLSADIEETEIPRRYITLMGMVDVVHKAARRGGGDDTRAARWDVEYYSGLAELFKAQNPPYRMPMRLTEYPGAYVGTPNWPYGDPLAR